MTRTAINKSPSWQLADARSAIAAGRVETAVEMSESLRAKLVVSGKGVRKGLEELVCELDILLGIFASMARTIGCESPQI